MIFLKTLVWLIFFASQAGFLLGAILLSSKARDYIVEMWFSASSDLEAPSLADVRRRFYEYLLRMVLLNANGRVSRWKTLLLALIGVLFLGMAARKVAPATEFGSEWIMLKSQLIALPMHWIVEYLSVRFFFRKYKAMKNAGLAKKVAMATLTSLAITTAISLIFPAIFLGAVFIASMGLGTYYDPNVFAPLLSAVANGYGVLGALILDATIGFNVTIPNKASAAALAIASTLPTVISALLWLAVAAIGKSKAVLYALKTVFEKLGALTAMAVISASTFLFQLATGYMQALSF